MNLDDIENLTELARLEISESEKKEVLKDLTPIIDYINQIDSVKVDAVETKDPFLKNIFRDDDTPHDSELFTKALLEEAPDEQDGFIKVKKIL